MIIHVILYTMKHSRDSLKTNKSKSIHFDCEIQCIHITCELECESSNVCYLIICADYITHNILKWIYLPKTCITYEKKKKIFSSFDVWRTLETGFGLKQRVFMLQRAFWQFPNTIFKYTHIDILYTKARYTNDLCPSFLI